MFLDQLRAQIHPLRQALLTHPIYHDMQDSQGLRIFMQYHIFAVWDFMSLLKALQQRLSCVSIPWIPNAFPDGCRLVNEIVLGEESDADGAGGFGSHFELYLRAMKDFGADTRMIDLMIAELRDDMSVTIAMHVAEVPSTVRHFVNHTFDEIARGNVCRIASAFTFGREDLLPGVFQRIVDELSQTAGGSLDVFRFYLERHIELDGGEHGPMSEKLITSLCGTDPSNWENATDAAVGALTARLNFWDAIHMAILRAESNLQ